MSAPTRRRFLAISAAVCALGGGKVAAHPEARWRGIALGAEAEVRITGLDAPDARPILTAVEAELRRLETIFSLYRQASQLTRLNARGHLAAPAPELLEVLSVSDALHRATGGAFDPTVQPLFQTHARAASESRRPTQKEIAAARAAVGWDGVRFDTGAVSLQRAGAALTLNGIAQGYITDRIADLLRAKGLSDVLVNAGEVVALGHRPDGALWSAGIATPDGALVRQLTLSDRALATSAPKGTFVDPTRQVGHVFDPASGSEASAASLVAVSAPTAMVADGLSTALCVVPNHQCARVIAAFPGARLAVVI